VINPNRVLTDALVADGLTQEEAVEQVERVMAPIARLLIAGKSVRLPGVGDLKPKRVRVRVPGSCDRKAREECRVTLRGSVIWKGEPYVVEPPEKPKVKTGFMGRMA
jgi:nucleoid DNA-binding protein